MTYFNTPQTYKTEYTTIYPDAHHEYKPIQKTKGNYVNPAKPLLQPQPGIGKSWGAAKNSNNVFKFNPSIVQDGTIYYNTPGTVQNNNYPKTRFKTDSGRIVEVSPETLNKAKSVGHDVYVTTDFFSDGPDYTDRDESFEKKKVERYFKNYNQFQTEEFVTPGQKSIKLDSGRVINFEVKQPLKEIARCPKNKTNENTVEPNKHSYNLDIYDGPNKNPVIENDVTNSYLSWGMISQPQEATTQKPKMLLPVDEIEGTNGEIVDLSYYDASNVAKQEAFKDTSEIERFTKLQQETFFDSGDMSDELYKQILKTSAKAICDWLLSFRPYKPWIDHWKILEDNLKKTNLNVSNLSTNDKEIAYTLDKGEIIKFRWQDNKRFVPKDVFMYVLLHELTHESFPPSFQGHKDPFPQMLCLLCVAATEVGILNIENIPSNIYMSNGRPITSRESIKNEILFGINMLIEANKKDEKIVEYYQAKKKFVNKYS